MVIGGNQRRFLNAAATDRGDVEPDLQLPESAVAGHAAVRRDEAPVDPAAGKNLRQRRIAGRQRPRRDRSEEHTSELQSLMRSSYDVFCLTKKQKQKCRT